MPRYVASPLPDGCFWSGWAPPNVDWCEAELCGAVVNPAGTWSNLAYVVFGVWMIIAARRTSHPALKLFGPASLFVGATSFAYHASYTAFFQFFDFVGMFVFCMTIIAANSVRLGWTRPAQAFTPAFVGVLALSAALPLVSETAVPIQAMVVVLILFILAQEAVSVRRSGGGGQRVSLRWFAWALALIVLAALFSASDVTRAACDPHDHVYQGHAVWHVLSAASLAAMFLHQREVGRASDRAGRGAASSASSVSPEPPARRGA